MNSLLIIIFSLIFSLSFLVLFLLEKNKSSQYNNQLAQKSTENTYLNKALLETQKQLKDVSDEKLLAMEQKLETQTENTKIKVALEHLQKDFDQQEENQKTMKEQFSQLAKQLLQVQSEHFADKSAKEINTLLAPVKEKLAHFEKKIDDTYIKGLKDQTDLQAELKKLHHLNSQLSKEAQSLTNALQTDNKQQGNWGEMVLEKILESSGLTKGREYKTQVSFTNQEDKRFQPDAIIYLPENKHLVIDSKVSLISYSKALQSENHDETTDQTKKHIQSIQQHIDLLHKKNYTELNGINSPDFVLMFIPIESALALALKAKQELIEYAWKKKITLVTPTTLTSTLLTIASLWRLADQNNNAKAIAQKGTELYDKLALFVESLHQVGFRIDQTKLEYQTALNRLSTGKGNVLKKAEELKGLGISTQKEIGTNG
jgi:DNA recombination protein RmuC